MTELIFNAPEEYFPGISFLFSLLSLYFYRSTLKILHERLCFPVKNTFCNSLLFLGNKLFAILDQFLHDFYIRFSVILDQNITNQANA